MKKRSIYQKPESLDMIFIPEDCLFSIDGTIRDMEEESGDYDGADTGSIMGNIDGWTNGSSF